MYPHKNVKLKSDLYLITINGIQITDIAVFYLHKIGT